MLKKLYSFTVQLFLAYIIAFFIIGIPFIAKANDNSLLNTSVFERSGNSDLLYSILHGTTKLAKNVTGDSTTVFLNLDSPMSIIAKYSPLLGQGRIALVWVHNFLIPQNYTKWVDRMKKEGKYGKIWFSAKAYDIDGVWRSKAVVFRVLTPQEAFKPLVLPNGQVLYDGKLLHNLGSNVNYTKIESCSANHLSSAYCSNLNYKAGQTLFFDIVSAVARKFNVSNGFVVVQKISTHHEVHKHHGLFKSKVTVKYYIDSYPQYYMLVPPNTPGTNTPTSGFSANGMGYLKVDKNTALGWDWQSGSAEYYQTSHSGWNGWVGIGIGALGMLGGFVVGPELIGVQTSFLTGLGVASTGYSAWATVQVARHGDFGTFHGLFQYNKLSASLGNNMLRKACYADALAWGNAQFGHEFDGSSTMLNINTNLKELKYSGMPVFKSLTKEQRQRIKEMQEQKPN